MKAGRKRIAFTLIELLIVVAIIAILAAIAVPNFLEAQVRAKVSRVKADQRNASVAIESYAVDNTRVPVGTDARMNTKCVSSKAANYNVANRIAWSKLTSPIAYMTSVPDNVFLEKGSKQVSTADRWMQYQDFNCPAVGANLKAGGYTYGMFAYGPSRNQQYGWGALIGIGWTSNPPAYIQFPYDASNGTVSNGIIVRTNKGYWSAPFN